MLDVNTIIFFRRIYMEIELSSERREMLLLLTTYMAAVTSSANHNILTFFVVHCFLIPMR